MAGYSVVPRKTGLKPKGKGGGRLAGLIAAIRNLSYDKVIFVECSEGQTPLSLQKKIPGYIYYACKKGESKYPGKVHTRVDNLKNGVVIYKDPPDGSNNGHN
jgi:hypothetical protein